MGSLTYAKLVSEGVSAERACQGVTYREALLTARLPPTPPPAAATMITNANASVSQKVDFRSPATRLFCELLSGVYSLW